MFCHSDLNQWWTGAGNQMLCACFFSCEELTATCSLKTRLWGLSKLIHMKLSMPLLCTLLILRPSETMVSGLPLQGAWVSPQKREQGTGRWNWWRFQGRRWMETSGHFKQQHLKGSGIFLHHRQDVSVSSYRSGAHVLHLIWWLIWRDTAWILAFI